MAKKPEYSVAIRTLGTAGEKYQRLLDSINNQSLQPKDIFVYIADGYPIPQETIGREKYIYVKKGMASQRALQYTEINTEYILFLDDDLFLPEDTVETMFRILYENGADIISPDIFPNAERKFIPRIMMTLSGRMRARDNDDKWGYKVMRTAGYSYNNNPTKESYISQTNAGACFLCSKSDFLKIRFQDELWLDDIPYPLGEDQVMYYKMYKLGLTQLTWFNSKIVHLDGGGTYKSAEKEKALIYADFRFKTIFWHRFLYSCETSSFQRILDIISITYAISFTLLISLLKCNIRILKVKIKAVKDAVSFIKSPKYKSLPPISQYRA